MRVVITAGGTAGHVNPALAVARALIAHGVEILYAGTPNSFEERLVAAAGISFTGFFSKGFNRRKPWTLVVTAFKLLNSRSQAKRWLKSVSPDVVVAFGGYASLPVALAANSLGLPVLVHEQNARPGLANKLLAKKAAILAISDERAITGFHPKANTIVTGNPLREELFGIDPAEARQELGFSLRASVLLIFGGSLGAHHVNQAALALAKTLLAECESLEVLHVTGANDYAWATELAKQIELPTDRWQIVEYCYQMGQAYAAADLVLSRAGATSLAELTALGKASLLIPYPYAAADEQTANAERLAASGAALVWPDNQLEQPEFGELLLKLLNSADMRSEIAEKAAILGKPEATEMIAQLVIGLANDSQVVI
ncbi:MAG: undecaprenyldiphospho-muramoylpentapeptide beta-N-acetylglucosaminyltransferase [Coriobacteriia bacterium]|nr:undecaprenyldiphospho-muramoylpentapeptide beta-N-acetylglucosaminyltransferase [Coriobacteriia bacterium]